MCIWCVGMPGLCWLQQTHADAVGVCSGASRGYARPLLLPADKISVAGTCCPLHYCRFVGIAQQFNTYHEWGAAVEALLHSLLPIAALLQVQAATRLCNCGHVAAFMLLLTVDQRQYQRVGCCLTCTLQEAE
jgi:hypothetical protein